jgi:hypothetical protein
MSIRAPYRNCTAIGLSCEMKIFVRFALEPRDPAAIASRVIIA